MQHQKGESVFYPPEWFEKKAAECLVAWVNGVEPPEPEEQKANWKKEFYMESAGHMVALWLLLQKHFKRDGAPPVKCTLQRANRRRSGQQNRAQWGLLYKEALGHYTNNLDHLTMDAFEAIKFGVNKDFIHEVFKLLFNDGKSTAGLTTAESSEYANKIREHFFDRYGVELSEPINPDEHDSVY